MRIRHYVSSFRISPTTLYAEVSASLRLDSRMVHKITSASDLETRLKSAGKTKLIVVDFYADWCGPCVNIAPIIEGWSKDEYAAVGFLKVDVDAGATADICQEHSVECMPTFLLFKDGVLVDRLEGANEKKLRDLIAKHK